MICTLGSLSVADTPKPKEVRDRFFAEHTIPRIRIHLEGDALTALRNKYREYTEATVTEGTNTWRDVGIHLKGQYGTFQGIDAKPSLTLNFDKYVKGQRFHGLDKLHLNNSIQDPSYLCEIVGRQLFAAAGVPVGRASHARVELNGRDLGLFVLVEGFDGQFLKRHFQNSDGNLYDSGFRHDITEPLKKGSGKGPDDHSDLRALAAAAGEQDHVERMRKLSALLDLDRFYTMMALETLIRHHDGYSIGINNFWIYVHPNTGRATFMPHGMDQLFFEPRAPLLPDLAGIVARRILETQTGRSEFRSRCVTLYTNLFPTLSNRVETAWRQLRPALDELSEKTRFHANDIGTNVLQRIHDRTKYLEQSIFQKAELPVFTPAGMAVMTNWTTAVEGGRAAFIETNGPSGPTLQVRVSGTDKSMSARLEKLVHLSPGNYRFSAKVTADQAVFRGPSAPVSLKVWGIEATQLESVRISPQEMELSTGFDIAPANAGESLLQVIVRSRETSVTYQITSAQLTQ